MSELKDIKKKLLGFATKSDDLDTIVKAVQATAALKTIGDFWPSLLTNLVPVLAVLLPGLALIENIHETNQKAAFERRQAEDSEWRDVLKNISLENPNSVQMGLFGLQGFIDSQSDHAGGARAMAVVLLPLASSEDGFDITFAELVRKTSDSNQEDLFAIGRRVSTLERDLMVKAVAQRSDLRTSCKKAYPDLFFAREDCFTDNVDLDSPMVDRIWLYSWEIDSVSNGLLKLWKRPDSTARPKNQILSGLIFQDAKFEGLDFSGAHLESTIINASEVPHVHFNNTFLTNSTFRSIHDFADTTWDGADWWNAASLPCDLADYLNSKYLPSEGGARARAMKLKASCTRE
jgi:hypothetical protein